jgi:AcrR family transcriptional regulator
MVSRGGAGGRRRRGAALEAAILAAAWDELVAVGYANLTMEGVAARARTSRAVLYRRWRGRPDLALAALRARAPMLSGPVPDTGSLREDVLALLRRMSLRLGEVGPEVIYGLISEYFRDWELYAYLLTQVLQVGAETMLTILGHAAARGEVRLAEIPRRIATLPVDLARHEVLITRAPVTEATILAIVDDIFLPLVLRARDAPPGAGPDR